MGRSHQANMVAPAIPLHHHVAAAEVVFSGLDG